MFQIMWKNGKTYITQPMLEATCLLAPALYPLVHSAYSTPSSLHWGDTVLKSSEGVQQGDPLGPLLFCLTIHQITSQLKSELCVFYLDDGSLGGYLEDVINNVETVERLAGDISLVLNHHKTEIICADSSLLLRPSPWPRGWSPHKCYPPWGPTW